MTGRSLAAFTTAAALLTVGAPASRAVPNPRTHLIQPGVQLTIGGGTCTANFVYQDTPGPFDPTQQLYIGTAGHCGSLGGAVSIPAAAVLGHSVQTYPIGTVVFDDDSGADFALVAIDRPLNDWVSPSVRHLGGPVGVYTGPGRIPVAFSGHGRVVGTGGTPRYGLLNAMSATGGTATIVTAYGDSGGPFVTTDGLAVGLLHGSFMLGEPGIGASAQIPRVYASVAGVSMATCPTATPWYLPGCPPA